MTNVPTATISQVKKILGANVVCNVPTLLFGQPGLGKTTIVEALGRAFADRFTGGVYVLSTRENNPIDLAGLYHVEDGKTQRAASGRIPLDKPVLILIDELGDCVSFEQSAWYRLINDHTLGEHKLADGSYVCAASNRPEDSAAAREISTALKGRCLCVTLQACYQTLLQFGYSRAWDSKLLGFIRAFGETAVNDGFDPDDSYAGATPRDYERLNRLESAAQISADPTIAELQCVGCLGQDVGAKYLAFREIETPDPQLVLQSPDSAPVPSKVEEQCCYAAAIIGACEDNHAQFANVVTYAERTDRVSGFGLVWDLRAKFPSFRSSPAWADAVAAFQDLLAD